MDHSRTPTRGRRFIASGRFIAAAALLGMWVAALGCDGTSRFPICKTDKDCLDPEGQTTDSPHCYDLRCVECRNDEDCKVGSVCSLQTKTCQALDAPKKEDPDDKAKAGGWDAENWEECAERCKDKACIADCDERFENKQ